MTTNATSTQHQSTQSTKQTKHMGHTPAHVFTQPCCQGCDDSRSPELYLTISKTNNLFPITHNTIVLRTHHIEGNDVFVKHVIPLYIVISDI